MSIPVEATSFSYTPPAFVGIEGAPKFTIRYGTRRDRSKFQMECAREGLIRHDQDDIRATILSEMKRLSGNSDEAKEKMVLSAERFWAAVDSLEIELQEWAKICEKMRSENPECELPDPPKADFDVEEEAWITPIINQVCAESPIIRNMSADNVRRDQVSREISLSLMLVDVEGFELRRRMDKVIETESLIELEEWLGEKADEFGVLPSAGDPYDQLKTAAFMSFLLPKEAEKNFASPPPTISDQNGSTLDDTTIPSNSKASAKSQSIPENSSATPTSESSTLPSPAETGGEGSNGPTVEPS